MVAQVAWTFDDLFTFQYPFALLGVTMWALFFCCAEAVAIVYRRSFDELIDKFQLVLYGFAGPGFLFIVKNLMKPLFCLNLDGYYDPSSGTPFWERGCPSNMTAVCPGCNSSTMTFVLPDETVVPMGQCFKSERIASYKSESCWSENHLMLCTISLFSLCIFLPSATLTNAIRFSAPEDIRFVYLFLRLELLIKGIMVFLSLGSQNYQMLALTSLILGSISICVVTKLMQPCCQKHVNRLKYLVHACSIWTCLTCMVSHGLQLQSPLIIPTAAVS